jgi:hypothetical protein
MTYKVVNITRNTTLGVEIALARSSRERRTGLLKQDLLKEGYGLWIAPCEAIHTMFMQFAIDVVFLDRKYRVRKIQQCLLPWRMSLCLAASSVLELPVGTIAATSTVAGDQLVIGPAVA